MDLTKRHWIFGGRDVLAGIRIFSSVYAEIQAYPTILSTSHASPLEKLPAEAIPRPAATPRSCQVGFASDFRTDLRKKSRQVLRARQISQEPPAEVRRNIL
jgi:hypothetical protein